MSFGRGIALFSFLLSLGTILVMYYVGVEQGTAKACNPFLTGCTDITHAGMAGDAGFIFRGGLIAGCALFIIWWLIMHQWMSGRYNKILVGVQTFFAVIACLGLLVATAVLVPESDQIPWGVHVRGANLFFLLHFFILAINIGLLWYGKIKLNIHPPSLYFKSAMVLGIIIVLMLFAGLIIDSENNRTTNISEWWATSFIAFYYLSGFLDWKNVKISVNN